MNENDEKLAVEFSHIVSNLVLDTAIGLKIPPHIVIRALELALERGKDIMSFVDTMFGPPPPDEE